jgi:hypothetical protein
MEMEREMDRTRSVNIDKFEARIKEVEVEIEKLRAKAAEASVEARDRLVRNLDSLVVKEKAAREKLEQYRASGADRMEALHLGLEQAWDTLKKTLDVALKN